MARKFFCAAAAALLCSFAFVGSAQAGFVLRLHDSATGTTVVVGDGSGADLSSEAGQIVFFGTVGRFTGNIASSISNQADSPETPYLNLIVQTVTNTAASTLTVEVTQTDFGPSTNPMPVVLSVNSSSPLTEGLKMSAYIDTGNAEFAKTSQIGSEMGPINGDDGDGQSVNVTVPGGTYSLTMVTSITHTTRHTGSYDATLSTVPEPATLLVWCGLVGMCVVPSTLRRLKK